MHAYALFKSDETTVVARKLIFWKPFSEEYVPGAARKGMEWQYFVGDCSDPNVQLQAKENFQNGLNSIFGGGDSTWCQTQNACSLENIRIRCGTTQKRRRRAAQVRWPFNEQPQRQFYFHQGEVELPWAKYALFLFQDIITIELFVSVITKNNNFEQAKSALEQNVTNAKVAPSMQSIEVSGSESMTLNNVTDTPTYGVCVNGSVFGLNTGFDFLTQTDHSQRCRKWSKMFIKRRRFWNPILKPLAKLKYFPQIQNQSRSTWKKLLYDLSRSKTHHKRFRRCDTR